MTRSRSLTFDSSSPTPPPAIAPSRPRAPEFLPAIHIRSQPLPSHFLPPEDPLESHRSSIIPPQHPSEVWKEWYLAASKHGPARTQGPPVFVLASGNYDELGRSTLDGVGVDIEDGESKKKREVESGDKLAEWYAALSGSGSSTPRVEEARPVVKVGKEDAIDLTMMSEDEDDAKPVIGRSGSAGHGGESIHQGAPLRVNPNEWYIRRALLKRQKTSTDPPPRPKRTIPIGSLLGVTPIQQVKSAPKYALGPENKGYDILKNTLGWHGGGLGKPEGWQPRDVGEHAEPGPPASQNLARELERDLVDASANSPAVAIPPKEENGVIDFTADSDDDDPQLGVDGEGFDSDLDDLDTAPDAPSGPGRTVPVATTLKLDRLGLGHRRTNFDAKGNPLKRVTHTHKEIEEAQRRAKRPMEKKGVVDPGKKEKVKWSLKDKKERDERRRIAAALNA